MFYSNVQSPKSTTKPTKKLHIEEECDRESTTLTFRSIKRVCSRCANLKREYECQQT